MILWLVGGTIAVVRYVFRDERMDLRFLAAGALLPDVIDLPIGLLWFSELGATQLAAHSLLFSGVLMAVVVLATRRGRPRRRWMGLPIGTMVHLVLNLMWDSPETLWWPFLGREFTPNPELASGGYAAWLAPEPMTLVFEAAGLAYLVVLWRKARLGDAERRSAFLRTGIIDAAIG